MPVILRAKGYRFWFYEVDLDEPAHVHVAKEGLQAKYWLDPIALARAGRFKPVHLREIERIIRENISFLLSVWEKERNKRVDR